MYNTLHTLTSALLALAAWVTMSGSGWAGVESWAWPLQSPASSFCWLAK